MPKRLTGTARSAARSHVRFHRRTTVEYQVTLPPDLARRVQHLAARHGLALGHIVEIALARFVSENHAD
jgi:hypothetical protein